MGTGVVCRSSSPPAASTRSGLVLRQLDLQAGGSRRSYAQLSPGSAVGVAAGVAMPAGSGRRSGSAIAAQCTCLLRPSPKVWCRPAVGTGQARGAPSVRGGRRAGAVRAGQLDEQVAGGCGKPQAPVAPGAGERGGGAGDAVEDSAGVGDAVPGQQQLAQLLALRRGQPAGDAELTGAAGHGPVHRSQVPGPALRGAGGGWAGGDDLGGGGGGVGVVVGRVVVAVLADVLLEQRPYGLSAGVLVHSPATEQTDDVQPATALAAGSG